MRKPRSMIPPRLSRLGTAALLLAAAAFAGAARAQGDITLNFKDADLGTVAETVAEITGRNFIIDPRVKGNVTVVSSHGMGPDQVYQVFLSILQVHGFAAVEAGEVVKIIPDASAKQDAVPTDDGVAGLRGDEVVTRVVPVQNVQAVELVPLLRPLVPQQGHLAAHGASNTLIVSDRARNVERLVTMVRRIDQADDGEVDVIRLGHASAAEVARVLDTLMRSTAPGGAQGAPSQPLFVADERTNSILVGGDRNLRLRVRTLVSHLDTPVESTGNTQVMFLRYGNAEDIAKVLKAVAGTLATAQQDQGEGGGPPRARTGIEADAATNSLIITAAPDVMASLESVARRLDVRRAQVLVEAIIAEVSLDKTNELGVQWIVDGTPGGSGPVGIINFSGAGSPITGIADAIINGTGLLPDGATIGIGRFDSDSINFAAVIRALAADASTNLLSTPSLVTLDNEEAEIIVGQNVPFLTGSYTSIGDAGATPTNPFQTIEREDIGVTLRVTPQINEGDTIQLHIEQEVSNLVPSLAATDLITSKRAIKTSVLVDSGQIIVLGGLMDDFLQETEQKVPGLGSIPLVGELFRYRETSKTKRNLLVFLRPVILRDAAVAGSISGGKYRDYRRLQLSTENPAMMPTEQRPALPPLEQAGALVALPEPFDRATTAQ